MPSGPPEASPQNIELALSLLAQADQGALRRAMANRSDEDQRLRQARLTTLLKPLAARLEEEVKGFISLQESFQQEDAINAEERAIGRREAAKRREQERRLLLNNICYLRLEKAPEGLPPDQQQFWQWRNEHRLATFEEAVKRFRRGGRLLEVDQDDGGSAKHPAPSTAAICAGRRVCAVLSSSANLRTCARPPKPSPLAARNSPTRSWTR